TCSRSFLWNAHERDAAQTERALDAAMRRTRSTTIAPSASIHASRSPPSPIDAAEANAHPPPMGMPLAPASCDLGMEPPVAAAVLVALEVLLGAGAPPLPVAPPVPTVPASGGGSQSGSTGEQLGSQMPSAAQ